MQIYLKWSVTYAHDSNLDIGNSIYFRTESTKAPYSALKAPQPFAYPAVRLIPTQKLHLYLKKVFAGTGLVGAYPRFPYSTKLADGTEVDLNFSVLLFRPRIIALTFKVSEPLNHSLSSLHDNARILNFRDNARLHQLAAAIINRLTDGLSKSGSELTYDHAPALNIKNIESDHFPTWQEQYRQSLTKILIRSMSSGFVRDELVRKLFAKCEQFNYKSSEEYLLVDKQGLLMLSSRTESPENLRSREKTFRSAFELTMLAQVYRAFLVSFLELRATNQYLSDFLLSRVESWCSNPHAVLHASVTNMNLWDLLAAEFRLIELYDLIMHRVYVRTAVQQNMQDYDAIALVASSCPDWYSQMEHHA